MMKPIKRGLFVAVLLVGLMQGHSYSADFSSSAELGVDASLVAVGNGMGWGETPAGVLISPVAVGQRDGLALSYWSVMTDQTVAVLSGAYQIDRDMKVGIGLVQESISGINQSIENGDGEFDTTGQGSYSNSELAVGFLHRLSNHWVWGVSGTWVKKDILGTTASGLGLSGAASWRTDRLDMAITLRHFNQPTILDSDGGQEVLPAELDIAGRYHGFLIPAIDLVGRGTFRTTQQVVYPSVGVQVTPFSTDALLLSAGYAALKGTQSAYRSVFTGGVSLGLDRVRMHYALLFGDVADSQLQHKFSVGVDL